MRLEPLVAPLRQDVVSGAAQVARAAARAFVRVAGSDEPTTPEELEDLLSRLAVEVLEAQPAMAPLVSLGATVLRAVSEADDLSSARRRAREAAEGMVDRLEEESREVAREAARLLPTGGTVLTHSNSSTVREALESAAGDERLTVICLEGRPMQEGRRLSERLAGRPGPRVIHAVDAAGWSLAHGADLVLVGADSIGDRGVLNKIGTCALAGAARSAGIPFVVLAGRSKLLPPGFPQPTDDDRRGDEVWHAPRGVRIWNRYFETLPLESVTSVVTDEGVRDPSEVRRTREALEVPEALRAWAEGRGREG